MTVAQIKERIAKAEEKVAKKENTIVKKTAQIEKKKNALVKLGVDIDRVFSVKFAIRDYENDSNWNDIYWTYCDINNLTDDIQRGKGEIEEIKAMIGRYNDNLVEAQKKLDIFEAMPEIMVRAMKDLIEQWDIFDIEHKAQMNKIYRDMEAEDTKDTPWGQRAYRRFLDKYSYQAYQDLSKTEEEIHKDNVRSANAYMLDLYNRVIAKTGDITSIENLHCAGPALNGYITGILGTVEVRTILAGGYNIQRLHCRTLVL